MSAAYLYQQKRTTVKQSYLTNWIAITYTKDQAAYPFSSKPIEKLYNIVFVKTQTSHFSTTLHPLNVRKVKFFSFYIKVLPFPDFKFKKNKEHYIRKFLQSPDVPSHMQTTKNTKKNSQTHDKN